MTYTPHKAEYRLSRNSEGDCQITRLDPDEYIPCAASFVYWPQTKDDWENGIAWLIYICALCLIPEFPRANH